MPTCDACGKSASGEKNRLKRGLCRSCYRRARYLEDPERERKRHRNWRAKNREKVRGYCKKWRSKTANQKWCRGDSMKRHYGITPDIYDAMEDAQGGVCAICGGTNRSKRLAIDHCHSTGRIRGLLCAACNAGIGMFQDDPELLRAAAVYADERMTREPTNE